MSRDLYVVRPKFGRTTRKLIFRVNSPEKGVAFGSARRKSHSGDRTNEICSFCGSRYVEYRQSAAGHFLQGCQIFLGT
jgi:hypothetical protein